MQSYSPRLSSTLICAEKSDIKTDTAQKQVSVVLRLQVPFGRWRTASSSPSERDWILCTSFDRRRRRSFRNRAILGDQRIWCSRCLLESTKRIVLVQGVELVQSNARLLLTLMKSLTLKWKATLVQVTWVVYGIGAPSPQLFCSANKITWLCIFVYKGVNG